MRANTLGPRDQGLLPAGGFEPPNGGIKIRSIPACNINARPKADMKSNVGASAKGHNRTWWLPESLHSWNIRCGSAIPSEAVRSLVQVSAFFGNLRHFRGLTAVPKRLSCTARHRCPSDGEVALIPRDRRSVRRRPARMYCWRRWRRCRAAVLANDYEANFYLPFQGFAKPIYAIPGNHDWYDALEGFNANFLESRAARAAIEARVATDFRLTSSIDPAG